MLGLPRQVHLELKCNITSSTISCQVTNSNHSGLEKACSALQIISFLSHLSSLSPVDMLQTIKHDRNHVQRNINVMKVSSGLCVLALVHLCERQIGVLLVKREGMNLE